jgi:hypothetical protein
MLRAPNPPVETIQSLFPSLPDRKNENVHLEPPIRTLGKSVGLHRFIIPDSGNSTDDSSEG